MDLYVEIGCVLMFNFIKGWFIYYFIIDRRKELYEDRYSWCGMIVVMNLIF